MPVSTEPSSSSTTIGQHIRLRPRNLPPSTTADEPLIPKPSRICKSAMSSFFLLPSSSSNETTRKKPNGFPQTTSSPFRGLGCTASASQQVSVPAVIRSSADWDASNFKTKKNKSKNKGGSYSGGSIKILSESADRSACGAIPDVWCGPGVGFGDDLRSGDSSDSDVESDGLKDDSPDFDIENDGLRDGDSSDSDIEFDGLKDVDLSNLGIKIDGLKDVDLSDLGIKIDGLKPDHSSVSDSESD